MSCFDARHRDLVLAVAFTRTFLPFLTQRFNHLTKRMHPLSRRAPDSSHRPDCSFVALGDMTLSVLISNVRRGIHGFSQLDGMHEELTGAWCSRLILTSYPLFVIVMYSSVLRRFVKQDVDPLAIAISSSNTNIFLKDRTSFGTLTSWSGYFGRCAVTDLT